MMDRFESMSILIEAVDAGSLSAAARRLNMPLPTVSRKVGELEAYLKTQLLNRSARKLTLTDAGRAYVVACKQILESVRETERAAMGEYNAPQGELTITAPIVFGRLHILPIVIAFLKAHPNVTVHLVQTDRVVDLLEDHVDVAVRIGELPDSSLVAARVGVMRRVVCASHGYLAERGTPAVPRDLKSHDCITFDRLNLPNEWTFKAGQTKETVEIRSRLVVNTAEAAIDAATAGVGLTCVLSYQIAQSRADGTVAVVLRDYEPAPSPVSLVYSGQRLLPQKLRLFLDFAVPRLKDSLRSQSED
jgi:DNA-binding transcriptional LysR family regulator